MSWQACKYAREVLEADVDLKLGARLVLLLAAERANRDTAQTYSGDWLVAATGMHPSSVRRSLYELADCGAIALRFRPGKATVIRFPLSGALSTPRADGRAVEARDPAPERALPRAETRATPRPEARRTSQDRSVYPAAAAQLCALAGCECGGDGWVHVDDGGRGWVRPCAGRSTGSAGPALEAVAL